MGLCRAFVKAGCIAKEWKSLHCAPKLATATGPLALRASLLLCTEYMYEADCFSSKRRFGVGTWPFCGPEESIYKYKPLKSERANRAGLPRPDVCPARINSESQTPDATPALARGICSQGFKATAFCQRSVAAITRLKHCKRRELVCNQSAYL